ncbi:hypothetical protein JCM10212_005559 [Sporobolomyces blumeae]
MTSLRTQQRKAYFKDPTKEDLFREAFGLPDDENPLGEVHAVLFLAGQEEAFSGKLYLSTSFITFTSLDRRSCRLTLPLATVRRVEKLAPGQEGTEYGAFALALTLFHGLSIIVQLNSLRPTNDAFCANLRIRLKASLPMMKSLKPFSHTFFSEWYLSPERHEEDDKRKRKAEDDKVGELISFDDKGKGKETDSDDEWTTEWGTEAGFHAGLGMVFRYPGDPRKLREKSKMKLWKEYLTSYGRNLTLVRYPSFTRLVLVGLPNRLRGEVWELACGSMFLRLHNPGVYAQILHDNEGRRSASTDDIEKDLHRSLPEYSAYQDPRGIDAMRRVLTAYSWSNPTLGYCQAMNLIVASFLIYMSEEQCFWCLSVLCDRMLPGYYSPSMYGTVLDQRVFEHLVQRCLPTLHDHFVRADIQLSVASLPWFLSLYISSMPMVFAFRIIDCFFLMGPKVLFQVGLAILKLNAGDLLETTDDGAFINVLKAYFLTLGDSAYPHSSDHRQRGITKFQELFVVAFREFSTITDDTIASERKRFRADVVVSIETFAKRTAIRNLSKTGRLSKEQLGLAYDHFIFAVLRQREQTRAPTNLTGLRSRTSSNATRGRESSASSSRGTGDKPEKEEKQEDRLDRAGFGTFMADVATWARNERIVKNGLLEHVDRQPADHQFIDRIFAAWDRSLAGSLSFQDIVTGLDAVLFNDLMMNLAWLFSIHDSDQDGYLTKDEILQVSEVLLFIFRNEPGDRYLGSVSNLIQNLFEFGESTKPDVPNEQDNGTSPSDPTENPNRPYLSLATFRMCILADALLEDFFESDLTASWRLEVLVPEEKPKPKTLAGGWWGGLVNSVMTDENKERFNRLADDIGKRLDIQTVEQRPSIGKLDAASAAIEPTARDQLFSTSNRKKAPLPPVVASPDVVNPLSAAAMRMPAYPTQDNPWADERSSASNVSSPQVGGVGGALDIDVQALAQQAMQRPQFTIDEATEGDGEEYVGDGDDGLLGQVDAMLEADDAKRGGPSTPPKNDEPRSKDMSNLVPPSSRPRAQTFFSSSSPNLSLRPPRRLSESTATTMASNANRDKASLRGEGWYNAPIYPRDPRCQYLAPRLSPTTTYPPSYPTFPGPSAPVPSPASARPVDVTSSSIGPSRTPQRPRVDASPPAGRPLRPPSPPISSTRRTSLASDTEFAELGADSRRTSKTPPSACGVCGVTQTPEWRKGPAGIRSLCNGCGLTAAKRSKEREARGIPHPATIEDIEQELQEVGNERFKPACGRYLLPFNYRQLIQEAQERTRAQQAASGGQARAKASLQDRAAAGTLVGIRRASISSTSIAPRSSAPSSATARAGRSGSVGSATSLSSTTAPSPSWTNQVALPPSSTYMRPVQIGSIRRDEVSPLRLPPLLTSSTPASASGASVAAASPELGSGASDSKFSPTFSPTHPRRSSTSSNATSVCSSSVSSLSLNRMSIAHLTTSDYDADPRGDCFVEEDFDLDEPSRAAGHPSRAQGP